MKLVKTIGFYASISLGILFSLLFGVLECRTLLSGDLTLMENVGITYGAYLFRILFFVTIIGLAVFILITHIKRIKLSLVWSYAFVILILGSLFTFIFYEWYIGLIIFLSTNFIFGAALLEFKRQ